VKTRTEAFTSFGKDREAFYLEEPENKNSVLGPKD